MNGKQIAVLGAGGWGIAIANLLAEKGHKVNLWEFDNAAAENLKATRLLPSKLPGIRVADSILVTNDLEASIAFRRLHLFHSTIADITCHRGPYKIDIACRKTDTCQFRQRDRK